MNHHRGFYSRTRHDSLTIMKKHAYTVGGLLMLGIFLWRGVEALYTPGLGWQEIYVLGGLILAVVVLTIGIRLHLGQRRAKD